MAAVAEGGGAQAHPNPKALWRNRRWMAWLATATLVGQLVFTMAMAAKGVEIPTNNKEVMIASLMPLALIIGAYIGFAVADKVWGQK